MYGLGNVCGKGHVIAEDRIETVGAGIDAVTDHVIVTVITMHILLLSKWPIQMRRISLFGKWVLGQEKEIYACTFLQPLARPPPPGLQTQ